MFHRRLFPGKQMLVLGGVFLILLSAAVPAAARPAAWTELAVNNIVMVSRGSQGLGGGFYPAISHRGRYVVFESHAADLAPGHIEDSRDVFVSDLQESVTQRVSMRSDGSSVYNPGDYTSPPSMGGSGRFVVFMSRASGLVPGDTNAMPDIFLRDRETGTTTLVSVARDGSLSNGPSFTPVVSNDGRFVAFQSTASNLVENDTNDAMDVFVRDMVTGITRRVSVNGNGAEGALPYEYPISSVAISADGSLVAFAYESLPFPGLASTGSYVFLSDLKAGATSVVGPGTQPGLSSDGRYLVFLTTAGLADDDNSYSQDVYLFDRQASAFERVTYADPGGPASQEIPNPPDVSDDGRYVVFTSDGGYDGTAPGTFHVYLRDRQSQVTRRVDRPMDSGPESGESTSAVIADDGSAVAFASTMPNLVPSDANNACDVFVFRNSQPSIINQDRLIFLPTLFR